MEKDKLEPKLRFPGFTEPWEQRKLIEITDRVLRKNKNLESKRPLTISAQDGLVDQETYFNKRIASENLSNYILVKRGEFAYNKSYSSGFPWGAIKRLDKYENGVVSSLYIVFSLKCDQVDPFFLEQYFDTDRWFDEIRIRAAEGARNHGLLNIPASDFFDINLGIPSIDEQIEIGRFLEDISKTIALHQRKEEELQKLKKGLLQKMFPKDGESVPEVRFPNFTDSWEQRKLGDIARFVNGRAYKQDELLSKGKYPILRVGNFYTNDAWYYSDLELDEKLYAKEGDLLYTWSATFGPHIWNGSKVIYHYHIWKVILSDKLEPSFALWLLEADKNHLLSGSNGSTMIHITKAGMENKEVAIPRSLSEQKNIGEFLNNLKQLITLHQRKTEELKKLKKALLQQMFV